MPSWPDFEFARWGILLALSLILPLSIFFGRGNIRKRRLAALDDLEKKAFGQIREREGVTLPYLDLVRARYEQAGPGNGEATTWGVVRAFLAEVLAYMLPTSIFVILSALGIYLTLSSLHYGFENPNLMMIGLMFASGPDAHPAAYQAITALIVSAAFLGAYVWSINYLILRVANFDLTPLDFLRVSAHLLLTTVIAIVFRHAAASASWNIVVAIVLVTAFMMGLIPSLGLNVLIDRLPPSLRIKRVVPQATEIGREFPLDLIDGIDTGIKFRLANYEINDAQNIATENPIGLYVATPYNLIEIMDWMAQAQLLVTLGPTRYLAAREKSIRDIHGLIAFGATPQGSAYLATLFFSEAMSDEVVQAKLTSIASDLHVERLTHLRDTIRMTMETPPRPAPLRLATG